MLDDQTNNGAILTMVVVIVLGGDDVPRHEQVGVRQVGSRGGEGKQDTVRGGGGESLNRVWRNKVASRSKRGMDNGMGEEGDEGHDEEEGR